MTLGSLFDGAGGFPLAGSYAGFEPVWASEIEPFPIRVTSRRFPDMLHLGDITEIHGGEIPPVDVITAGSPCQDFSVAAGKRKGLKGKRSALFMEFIRIVKEMREATNGTHPTFAVWENVFGIFSSNSRRDFQAVLHEFCKVTEPKAPLVPVPKNGWSPSGELFDVGGGSIAYRTLSAELWGVPQRRRRVFLVADFGGGRAGKILFESESLLGDFTQGGEQGKATAGTARERSESANNPPVICIEGNGTRPSHRGNGYSESGVSYTLNTVERHAVAYCLDRASYNQGKNAQFGISVSKEQSPTLVAKGPHAVAHSVAEQREYIIRRLMPDECALLMGFPGDYCENLGTPEPTEADIDYWFDVFESRRKAVGKPKTPKSRKAVRRWLQNPRSDNAEYKMWGNSAVIHCIYTVLAGIADEIMLS